MACLFLEISTIAGLEFNFYFELCNKNFKKIQQDGKNYIRLFLKYDEAEKSIIHGIEKIYC